MVTVKDQTAHALLTTTTLNEIPAGQLFRGQVYFDVPWRAGFHDGIFRKYRDRWQDDNGVIYDCMVVAQTKGVVSITRNNTPRNVPTSKPTEMPVYLRSSKVENYEPLVGELIVTKPR